VGAFRLPLKLADRLAPAGRGGGAQQAALCGVLLHLPGGAEDQPLPVAAQLVERRDDEGFTCACLAPALPCLAPAADLGRGLRPHPAHRQAG
jgi:hypothetical protein